MGKKEKTLNQIQCPMGTKAATFSKSGGTSVIFGEYKEI